MRHLKSYKIFESTKPDLPPDFVYGVGDILLEMRDEGYSYRLMYYTYNWINASNLSQDMIDNLVNDGVKAVGVDFPCKPGIDRDEYYEQIKRMMIRLFDYISNYPVVYGLHFDSRDNRKQLFLNNHSDIERFVDSVSTDGMIELCLHQK